MNSKLTASLAAALVLSGCATQTPPATQAAVDLRQEGIAKTCTPSTVDLAAASPAPATIAMSSDGWCGVFVADKGQPFQLGLVRARPAHGRVFIQPVNGQTRVEYTPNAGYAGADTFTVALRSRTAGTAEAMLRVNVTVAQGERPAVATPAAAPTTRTPAARPPARTPARPRS